MARYDPADLPDTVLAFVSDRHLATLTTLRPDGSPHVAPVGFTYDSARQLVRVITFTGSKKVRNIQANPGARAAVCQVDADRWLTFEGTATVTTDPARNAEGIERYAHRYRQPGERRDRATIEIAVDTVLGRA